MSAANSERVEYAVMSDIGRRRTNNQDAYIVAVAADEAAWHTRGDLFVVADGMGAHAAGELASRLAVEGVSHVYLQLRGEGSVEALRQAILDTNSQIHARGQENVEFHNMGTTCSALVLGPDGAVIGHVGDSRIYRLRGNQFEQLTFDHSLVWEMRAMGQAIGQQNAGFGLPKNVITRSLGPNAEVQVDVEGPLSVEVADRFLICSDGLTTKVEDAEMALILRHLPLGEAAQWLTDLANLRGGPDNITVMIIEAKRPGGPGHVAGDRQRRLRNWRLGLLAGAVLAAALGIAAVPLRATYLGAALALLSGGLAIASWLAAKRGAASLHLVRNGKGPYTSARIQPSPQMLDSIDESLVDTLEQVRDIEEERTIAEVQELLDRARAHRDSSRIVEACRCYAELTSKLLRLDRSDDGQGDLFN